MMHLNLGAVFQALLVCALLGGSAPKAAEVIDPPVAPAKVVAAVREAAHPLTGDATDYDPLVASIGDARFVLLGEATHGTHEFYRERARITRRLIEEKGFTAVVVEADWPDAYRVDRYVRGEGDDKNARKALSGFTRFPRWMWRNEEVRDFVEWLRTHNGGRPPGAAHVGFYGMDLYSLRASADAVTKYLKQIDPEAEKRARKRYKVVKTFYDPQEYGEAATSGRIRPYAKEVDEQLSDMRRRVADRARSGERHADHELFSAYQNARVVKSAEAYYRAMVRGYPSSWNLRDGHMADSVDALVRHLDASTGEQTKVVIWAHNSHVGDARRTQMGDEGQLNLGQLMRQRHGAGAVLVGFSTYSGKVRAASEWGGPGKRQTVRPALEGSYAAQFHEAGIPSFLLLMRGTTARELAAPQLERAIGVVYLPRTERQSHYFYTRLAEQFDAVIHYDVTRAVEALDW